MAKLTMADGQEITVLRAARGMQYAILHIYLNSLTMIEAIGVFDNRPEATKEMKLEETITRIENGEAVEETKETVFSRFTEMTSIQKTTYGNNQNAIMIRMQRPFDD